MNYNNFSHEFNATRQNIWPEFSDFEKYLQNGQRILDLGCGNARIINLLKKYEIEYVGCDISGSLLNYAKKQQLGKITHTDFIEEDMLKLNFQKSSFDIIFLIASFHHLRTKRERVELLKKMKSWLKKDAIIIMTNWNLWNADYFKKYFKYLFDFSYKKTLRDFIIPFRNSERRVLGKRFYHAFRLQELQKLIKNTGLKLIKNEFSKDKRNILTYFQKDDF
ncbi:MAG: class I SAM-dependent methyltransferase [Patescibacteria group bacterium]|nr:class I SAM-dependent methyltransferase [Patescibacteria group bacterium]